MKQITAGIGLIFMVIFGLAAPDLAFGNDSSVRVAQLDRLSPAERERVMRNYEKYQRLPPAEREKMKEQYRQYQQAPPAEKEKLNEKYHRYEQMSPEVKRNLENYIHEKMKIRKTR